VRAEGFCVRAEVVGPTGRLGVVFGFCGFVVRGFVADFADARGLAVFDARREELGPPEIGAFVVGADVGDEPPARLRIPSVATEATATAAMNASAPRPRRLRAPPAPVGLCARSGRVIGCGIAAGSACGV
jgi:hypothetical protein